jgi:hypothetical protein
MLRVLTARLNPKIAKQYCAVLTGRTRGSRSVATGTAAGQNLVIDLWSESESNDDWADVEPGLLSALVPIRNELMAGDYRALYLGWQLQTQVGEIATGTRPPPVPSGARRPTGSQQALVEFLRIDPVERSRVLPEK